MQKQYNDFVKFVDEDGVTKTWYVLVLDEGVFTRFETVDGNIISIPYTRIIKIKRKRGEAS